MTELSQAGYLKVPIPPDLIFDSGAQPMVDDWIWEEIRSFLRHERLHLLQGPPELIIESWQHVILRYPIWRSRRGDPAADQDGQCAHPTEANPGG